MNVVKEVKALIEFISNTHEQVCKEYNRDCGVDYDHIEYMTNYCQTDIDCFVEGLTNPTLPCLYKLHAHAKKHGYDVRALEVELAHSQLMLEN